MAKKKTKIISQEETQATTQILGNVDLEIRKGKNTIKKLKIHNEVTSSLLWGLIMGLSGTMVDDCLPKFISVGIGTTSDSAFSLTALKSELGDISKQRPLLTRNFRGPTIKAETYSVVATYQGIIQYQFIGSSTIRELGLFGTVTGNSLLARVQLSEDDAITLDAGESLVVNWTFALKDTNR